MKKTQTERVKLGLVQWAMRACTSEQALMGKARKHVKALADSGVDIILFPEFFNASLMAVWSDDSAAHAIRKLAGKSAYVLDEFREMATRFKVNIITGSMPELTVDTVVNAGYLCRRDGHH
jgi:predicted amidohydrolase